MRTLLVALLVAATAHAAPVPPFEDHDFAPAEWEIVTFSFRSDGGVHPGGSVAASQTTGGYPGTLRRVENSIVAAPSMTAFSTTWGVHIRPAATWNPSPAADGPIATLDYEEDAILLVGGGDGQLTGLAVRQGGIVYVRDVALTPEHTWTRKRRSAVKATDLYEIAAGGQNFASHPDFSGTGAPLEFGFFRANSNSPGGSSYMITGGIDNWKVRVNPPCITPADCIDGNACTADACTGGACALTEMDCGDGDPCTIDTCAGGICANPPLPCDDGDGCTVDGCANGLCTMAPVECSDDNACTLDTCAGGACQSTPAATFDLAEARIGELIAILQSRSCGGSELARALARKLRKKLVKARARVARADAVTRAAAVTRLLGRADNLLVTAEGIIDAAVARQLIAPACADALRAFLQDLKECVAGLPRAG